MMQWISGLGFSLLVGGVITWLFLRLLRSTLGEMPRLSHKGIPSWLTGGVERLFFTVLVGLEVPGAPAAMIGWLALKLATDWNHPDWKEKAAAREFALSALLGGLISMLFALIGGLVCAGKLLSDV